MTPLTAGGPAGPGIAGNEGNTVTVWDASGRRRWSAELPGDLSLVRLAIARQLYAAGSGRVSSGLLGPNRRQH